MRRPKVRETFIAAERGGDGGAELPDVAGLFRDRDAFSHEEHARGGPRLHRPEQAEPGPVLRAPAVAPALQADTDGGGLRQILPVRAVLQGRRPEGGPAAGVHPARPGDELCGRGGRHRDERRHHGGALRIDKEDASGRSFQADGLRARRWSATGRTSRTCGSSCPWRSLPRCSARPNSACSRRSRATEGP